MPGRLCARAGRGSRIRSARLSDYAEGSERSSRYRYLRQQNMGPSSDTGLVSTFPGEASGTGNWSMDGGRGIEWMDLHSVRAVDLRYFNCVLDLSDFVSARLE